MFLLDNLYGTQDFQEFIKALYPIFSWLRGQIRTYYWCIREIYDATVSKAQVTEYTCIEQNQGAVLEAMRMHDEPVSWQVYRVIASG